LCANRISASITLADLALVSALIYLDLRQPERDWRGPHPIARIREHTIAG
jgi:hypothetical protein